MRLEDHEPDCKCMIHQLLAIVESTVDEIDHTGHGCELDTTSDTPLDTTLHHTVRYDELKDYVSDGKSLLWINGGEMNEEAREIFSSLWGGVTAFAATQESLIRDPKRSKILTTMFEAGLLQQDKATQRVVAKTIVAMVKTFTDALDVEQDRVFQELDQNVWMEFTPESAVEAAEQLLKDDDVQS